VNPLGIDVCVAVKSSRFDLPLTYAAGEFDLRVGDVVRVPLANRQVLAFVVSEARSVEDDGRIRPVLERLDVPRAFDETGLQLARFVSEYYLCTLGEALGAVVLSGAIPRMVDSFVRMVEQPNPQRYPSVPARFVRLIWEEFPDGFSLDALLRHPEARRSGDRAALLRHVARIEKSGELRRERRMTEPKTQAYRVRLLYPGAAPIRGRKAEALVEFVRTSPGARRADAVLAGFTNAVIARAVKLGALEEREVEVAPLRSHSQPASSELTPTQEQSVALERINAWLHAGEHREALLYGVTGSGKTYVYVEAIKSVVRAGGRAIVLVPEISLTPQTARRFEAAFGQRVAVLHSALSERERFDAWQACMRGDIEVVVGARSAVFAPLRDVRLIVVDESHETSYKQDTVPRYHAVAVARERMRLARGVLVLGSATPSISSFEAAQKGVIELLELRSRATAQPMPAVSVVDLAREFETGNKRPFSLALSDALRERLDRNEKSVLFVNRRGSGSFMICRSCGFVPKCERCDVSLASHRSEGLLRCHYCDAQQPIPRACPTCSLETIRDFGIGTERVAAEVVRLFPDARVVRMDSDTTTRVGDHARLLAEFEERGDVLVGTQMVAKGLDFPTVTLVGVVAADIGLHVPDYRAAERTFALVTQVCGRSGRARPGSAIVQAYSPNHPAIVHAAAHDYDGFAASELAERRSANFPPFSRLVYLGVISRSRSQGLETAKRYAEIAREHMQAEVLGPAPYPIARLNDEWRYRVALKARGLRSVRQVIRERVLPLARSDRKTRLAINVDP
jgi:primosomal protein N' (replication factor Y) (superfamily II helicase)